MLIDVERDGSENKNKILCLSQILRELCVVQDFYSIFFFRQILKLSIILEKG